MDRQSVFTTRVLPSNFGDQQDTRLQIQNQLREFILTFRHGNAYVYR